MTVNVGFFLQGDKPDYFEMAALAVESVRRHMPKARIFHMTDADTKEIDGADCTLRIEQPMPMAMRRMQHNANCYGQWLFLDVDIIVQRDVSDVFEQPFDVALTDRDGTITYEGKFAEQMPYNLGVAFSRSPAFWKRVLYHMKTISPKLQEWMGDQLVICEMLKQRMASDFNVKILHGRTYNYPPKHDGDGADAALVHYKGPRKDWMLKRKEAA